MDFDSLKPDIQQASDTGIQPTKFDDLQDDNAKYETTGQQIKTGLEGAAEGVAGPLATAAETHLLGVKPEDIAGRRKANPIIHGAGQAAGLVGGALIPGIGEYTLGSKIAEAGSAISGLMEGSEAIRAATKAASEMALIQASDETSKWLENDPNQSMQSAIANVGLSAALGGVGGALFSKAGSAIKSLGEAPEQAAKGFQLNLDPLRANEPLFEEIASGASNKAKAESFSLGDKIAQAIKDNFANAASETGGAGLGAAIGKMTGIPGAGWAGALLGERAISPMLKSIIPAIGKRIASMDLSGDGFVTAVNAMEQAMKGRLMVEKAASSVFDTHYDAIKADPSMRDQLDKKIRNLQGDPQQSIDVMNKHLDHYLPDHAMSVGQTVGNSIQYLNSVRPNTDKQSPLDSEPKANDIAQAAYNRALDIAQKPLIVMNGIRQGNLTSTDIKHLANMYPALYDQMKSSLLNSMTDKLSKQEPIPYKSRLGLSLFMGQPLDSSMKPMSILASQPQVQNPQQQPNKPVRKNDHLTDIAKLDATPNQARAMKQSLKG